VSRKVVDLKRMSYGSGSPLARACVVLLAINQAFGASETKIMDEDDKSGSKLPNSRQRLLMALCIAVIFIWIVYLVIAPTP